MKMMKAAVALGMALTMTVTGASVSYTHLDVYKRQVPLLKD